MMRRALLLSSILCASIGAAGFAQAQDPVSALRGHDSNADIYVQLIDDDNSVTIAAASSREKDIKAQAGNKVEKSKLVGQSIARKAKELGIENVVFDRGGNLYHGRVKAVADGAREGGLVF